MILNDSFTFPRLYFVCLFVCENAHASAVMCALLVQIRGQSWVFLLKNRPL